MPNWAARVRIGQATQLLRQGGLVLAAVSLPRLGLSPAEVGHWEGLWYVAFLLGFGWLTGLTQTYLMLVRREPAPHAFGRRMLWMVAGLGVILLLATGLLHTPYFALLQLPPPPAWWWFFAYLTTYWPGLLYEQILLTEGRTGRLAWFSLLSFLALLAFLATLALGAPWETAALIMAAIGAMKLAFFLSHAPPERAPASVRPPGEILRTALPLIAFASIGSLTTAFDPWFVNYWYEGAPGVFAQFRYGTRELPLLSGLINGITIVALPLLTEVRTEGLAVLRTQSRRLMHWVLPGLALLLLTGRWWWPLLFTDAFLPALPLFQLYVFVIFSRLLLPVTVLTALGHTRILPWFAALELLLNVLLSLTLAPRFGLIGIVLATVLAYAIDKLCFCWYLYRKTGIPIHYYVDLRWYFGYLVLLICVWAGTQGQGG